MNTNSLILLQKNIVNYEYMNLKRQSGMEVADTSFTSYLFALQKAMKRLIMLHKNNKIFWALYNSPEEKD